MEHRKKPRLELSSESDSERDGSETDSDETDSSLSPVSSFASFSFPALAAFSYSTNFAPNRSAPINFNLPQPLSNYNVPQQRSSFSNVPSASGGNGVPSIDREQLRASFRAACEEINRELDIIMQPVKTKLDILKDIEEYIISLSERATKPYEIELSDDSYTTKVSLIIDKNNVTILRHNQADSQQSEGVPGPSRSSQNWLPPVNPFTSSVTLRQHLEAASTNNNHVRPRRMRPPPGFHPTPQYNVRGASASSVAETGQGASGVGMVRPPPGFHGIGEGAVGPSGNPSTTLGVLDTEAIIADLCRQSLSVVRQSVLLAPPPTPVNPNFFGTPTPEELLNSLVPRHLQSAPVAAAAARLTAAARYGAQGTYGNELWDYYAEAAAASARGDGIVGGGTAYWDDFLQKEVYDDLSVEQNSELWREFEEYQRIQYAPGSLRTGTTTFPADNMRSEHGAVGYSRPRTPRPQGRPIEGTNVQRAFDPRQHAVHFPQSQQDVLTLSDRFRNASIANATRNSRPPARRSGAPLTRNELLGALLLKRLKQRAANANIFSGTNNTTMNVPAPPPAVRSASAPRPSNNQGVQQPPQQVQQPQQLPCNHCTQNNNKAAGNSGQVSRDVNPAVPSNCNPCPICNNAHTVHDCPIRKQWDVDMVKK